MAVPSKIFKDVGIHYSSPFGAKSYVTLDPVTTWIMRWWHAFYSFQIQFLTLEYILRMNEYIYTKIKDHRYFTTRCWGILCQETGAISFHANRTWPPKCNRCSAPSTSNCRGRRIPFLSRCSSRKSSRDHTWFEKGWRRTSRTSMAGGIPVFVPWRQRPKLHSQRTIRWRKKWRSHQRLGGFLIWDLWKIITVIAHAT